MYTIRYMGVFCDRPNFGFTTLDCRSGQNSQESTHIIQVFAILSLFYSIHIFTIYAKKKVKELLHSPFYPIEMHENSLRPHNRSVDTHEPTIGIKVKLNPITVVIRQLQPEFKFSPKYQASDDNLTNYNNFQIKNHVVKNTKQK